MRESVDSLSTLGFISYRVMANETSDSSHFTIIPSHPTSSGVIVKYSGMAGNLPALYGNSIALWRGEVPNLNVSPLIKVEITTNNQDGEQFIPFPLEQLLYCLTYQVGKKLKTMCALGEMDLTKVTLESPGESGSIKPQTLEGNGVDPEISSSTAVGPTYVELQILELTTTNIKVFYSTLPGYLPERYQNWIGIWQGYAVPYNAPDPLKKSTITGDYSQGTILLDDISFSEYFTYTLIYFTGSDNTNAAALLYFDTKGELEVQANEHKKQKNRS